MRDGLPVGDVDDPASEADGSSGSPPSVVEARAELVEEVPPVETGVAERVGEVAEVVDPYPVPDSRPSCRTPLGRQLRTPKSSLPPHVSSPTDSRPQTL